MKIFGIILTLMSILTSQENIKEYVPVQSIILEGNITSMQKYKDSILVGNDFGEALEINNKNGLKNLVKLKNIASFYADSYSPKVYSIDRAGNKTLILSEGDHGSKELFIFENEILHSLNISEFPGVKKVAFVNENQIFLGLASNEIILYDLEKEVVIYKKQLSEAPFSDFSLDLKLRRYVLSCESGILYYGDINSGDVIAKLEGANKDNVYQVKMAHFDNNVRFITAGKDRKVGLYLLNLKTEKIKFNTIDAEFLVYSVGISKDGKIGAYMQDEEGNIRVFDIDTQNPFAVLKGHTKLLNNIIFLDPTHIVSSEDGREILFWEI